MPRKITAYACEFRCGKRTTTHYDNIFIHEKQCWYNPKNHTCKTCKYEFYFHDSIDNPDGYWKNSLGTSTFIGWVRECKNEKAQDFFDENFVEPKNGKQIKPIKNCPFWKSK